MKKISDNAAVAPAPPRPAGPAADDWRARVWAALLEPKVGRTIAHLNLTCKGWGELAEARFLAKALSLGLIVSKPFGDSAKYDFIVEREGRMARVQVKSAWAPVRRPGRYQINASPAMCRDGSRRPYRRSEVDFLVAYIAPEELWYVIPIKVLADTNHILLRTDGEDGFTRYREAWRQIFERRQTIWAMAEDFPAQDVPLVN